MHQFLPSSSRYGILTVNYSLPEEFPIIVKEGGCIDPQVPISDLHIHDSLEVGYCHEGSGIFVVGEKVFPYAQGDIVIINDYELHEPRNNAGHPIRHAFVWMDPVRLVGVMAAEADCLRTDRLCGPNFRNILPEREYPNIAYCVRRIIEEMTSKAGDYRSMVRSLTWTLMLHLSRMDGLAEEHPAPRSRDALLRVAPALHYLPRHLSSPLDIPRLAEMCHTSVTHFHRLFSMAVSTTPLNYLTSLRIRMASALLVSTGEPIINIAADVGYSALCSFNRNFRVIMGMSPREYRQAARAGQGSGRHKVARFTPKAPASKTTGNRAATT